jgi:hypothetical protein
MASRNCCSSRALRPTISLNSQQPVTKKGCSAILGTIKLSYHARLTKKSGGLHSISGDSEIMVTSTPDFLAAEKKLLNLVGIF